ncbi:hypothetical protein [Marinitenerispora sediminis]|uniref:Uncharacterized protein n=1 Tax=Marinitenerispora sediminis TaxID=1931232 RepID=A0A368T1P3_9ACTN|nr:hypothetical protein [Marinitenerispora sediminis]RCV52778.1 hypothetical protein DEF23_18440 [Marinitenerispora sediminis]RCV53739.1 hypothetical protein DEF28_09820 [Marinitenerispora sediminis]RCV54073.1 hypothetical protein DEF24_19735 [Marinitenerispora sediminis]
MVDNVRPLSSAPSARARAEAARLSADGEFADLVTRILDALRHRSWAKIPAVDAEERSQVRRAARAAAAELGRRVTTSMTNDNALLIVLADHHPEAAPPSG